MRRAAFVVLFCALGCNRTLDEDQCKKMVDKMVDLLAKSDTDDKVKADVKKDPRATMVRDTCVGKMTKSQYDCVMQAKTFEAALSCDGK